MKAVVTTAYGPVEVLGIQDVEGPEIGPENILVKIHAFSVNPVDWKIRKGDVKLLTGRRPPKILGGDYAGVVQDVGANVVKYKPGDRIWGHISALKGGAYAEYISAVDENLGFMPESLSFQKAASVPLVGLTAVQGLVKFANIKSGDHVLVNGVSGGVGSTAVQVAKALGCTVTGVCSGRNLDLAKKLGCDHILNYQTDDILAAKGAYDIFYDAVGSQSFQSAKRTLKAKGRYVTTLPTLPLMIFAPLLNLFRAQKALTFLIKSSSDDLDMLKTMVDEGQLHPIVDKGFPMADIRKAHTYSETGRAVGKIVLSVDQDA